MKKTIMALALSLSMLGCVPLEKRLEPPILDCPTPIIKTNLVTSDEKIINELIKKTPEGYTLLGDAVSGWNYICTSSTCGNVFLEDNKY